MTPEVDLTRRVELIERRLRRYQAALLLVLAGLPILAVLSPGLGAEGSQDEIRTKSLVIEDAAGRERIAFGAPIRESADRISPSTGFKILDPNGAERFGMGLFDDGRLVMGFDAPPGTGDDRNRERISIVADARGGAYIRFLNRKTQIPGRIVLGTDDRLSLEFWENVDGKLRLRVLNFEGERTIDAQ